MPGCLRKSSNVAARALGVAGFLLAAAPALAQDEVNLAARVNLQAPVTEIARDIYDMHTLMLVILGAGFLRHAWGLMRAYSDARARRAFRHSIVYLSLLFAALLADHYLRL